MQCTRLVPLTLREYYVDNVCGSLQETYFVPITAEGGAAGEQIEQVNLLIVSFYCSLVLCHQSVPRRVLFCFIQVLYILAVKWLVTVK